MPARNYMNYDPVSYFRQLQILEFAQACGRLWGTWQEKACGWQTFGRGAGLEPRLCSTISLLYPTCLSVLIEETTAIPMMTHSLLSVLLKP